MILLLIIALAVVPSIDASAEEVKPSIEAMGEQMMYFYSSASREEFEAIQRAMQSNLGEFEKNTTGHGMLAVVFLARASQKYGYELLDIGQLDDAAISLAKRADSPLARYVNDDTRVDPGKLDVWWISYFATGETSYLDKLLSWVREPESQAGAAQILVAGAASWSVEANCRQHQ